VRSVSALLVRRAVADHAVHDDQRRTRRLGPEGVERRDECLEVVGVGDVLHGPAVAGEARRHVLAEREIRAALDRDLVVVEPPQVVERDGRRAHGLVVRIDGLHAAQMQHGIQQRRRVADRQHEAVAVRPYRKVGVEAQVVLPQRVRHGGERHGRARMSGVRRLHRVDGQGTDRVDRQLVDRLPSPGTVDGRVHSHVVASPCCMGGRGTCSATSRRSRRRRAGRYPCRNSRRR
jgi:hypothetical protein